MSQYWLGGISLLLRVIELWKLELDLLEMKVLGIRSLFVSIRYLQILRKTVGTGSTWNEGLGSWVAHCFCFDPLPINITQDRTECRLYLEWFLLFNICFAFSFCHLIFFPSLLDWYWQIYYNTKSQAGASSSSFLLPNPQSQSSTCSLWSLVQGNLLVGDNLSTKFSAFCGPNIRQKWNIPLNLRVFFFGMTHWHTDTLTDTRTELTTSGFRVKLCFVRLNFVYFQNQLLEDKNKLKTKLE